MADDSKPLNSTSEYLIFAPADPAEYDAWFREQVEIGLREADDPATVWYTQDEVFAAIDKRREGWREQAEKQRVVA